MLLLHWQALFEGPRVGVSVRSGDESALRTDLVMRMVLPLRFPSQPERKWR